jgi:SPP1 family predicted phage head-tail adaptor
MRAGQLDTHGMFQSPTEGKDARGGRTITGWTTHVTAWVEVRPLAARERMAAGQTQADVDYELEARYVSTVTTAMRFLADDGRAFVLHGIQRFPRTGRMVLAAQAVT